MYLYVCHVWLRIPSDGLIIRQNCLLCKEFELADDPKKMSSKAKLNHIRSDQMANTQKDDAGLEGATKIANCLSFVKLSSIPLRRYFLQLNGDVSSPPLH